MGQTKVLKVLKWYLMSIFMNKEWLKWYWYSINGLKKNLLQADDIVIPKILHKYIFSVMNTSVDFDECC